MAKKKKASKKPVKRKIAPHLPTDIIEPDEPALEGIKRVLRSLKSTVQVMSAQQNMLWLKAEESIRDTRIEVKVLSDKQDKAFENFGIITKELHRLGILMEQMDRKIDTSLEVSKQVTENTVTAKDHSKRISNLETDVNSVKTAIAAAKI